MSTYVLPWQHIWYSVTQGVLVLVCLAMFM